MAVLIAAANAPMRFILEVDDDLAGYIIGHREEVLDAIREISGAVICYNNPPDSQKTEFLIRGTWTECDLAMVLIGYRQVRAQNRRAARRFFPCISFMETGHCDYGWRCHSFH